MLLKCWIMETLGHAPLDMPRRDMQPDMRWDVDCRSEFILKLDQETGILMCARVPVLMLLANVHWE